MLVTSRWRPVARAAWKLLGSEHGAAKGWGPHAQAVQNRHSGPVCFPQVLRDQGPGTHLGSGKRLRGERDPEATRFRHMPSGQSLGANSQCVELRQTLERRPSH